MRTATTLMLVLAIGAAGERIRAGEWHVEPYLYCQNCHIQHASEDGQTVPGGPFSTLLLKNTVNELCLSCHDGSDPTAPDVLLPVQMYSSTASGESGAGHFTIIGIDNMAGHNLGLGGVVPLQAEGQFIELSCASCHAVHGNGNYRNLVYDPAGAGDSLVLVDGADVFTQFAPDKPPTVSGSVAAYSRDNVGYRQAYSAWSASCHNQLQTNATGSLPAHFNSHPTDVALNEFPTEPHTDPVHWVSGIGEGLAIRAGCAAAAAAALPGERDRPSGHTVAGTASAGELPVPRPARPGGRLSERARHRVPRRHAGPGSRGSAGGVLGGEG